MVRWILRCLERFVGMGIKFILSGSDMSFMMAGAKARAGAMRKFQAAR